MSTGRFIKSVVREIERAQKQAERDRIRQNKEYLREQKRLENERIRQEREEEKVKVQRSKEQLRAYKLAVKKEWEKGKIDCEIRFQERNKLRLKYIN